MDDDSSAGAVPPSLHPAIVKVPRLNATKASNAVKRCDRLALRCSGKWNVIRCGSSLMDVHLDSSEARANPTQKYKKSLITNRYPEQEIMNAIAKPASGMVNFDT
ncbi:hypothetical protein [Halomonas caseinilytica]|uniref:hypothetical protein n=1 Tax=Halomonas caseinilytica TaxID=438744 RepID=UPI001113CDA7|nr:hypothetical protein [Halomonas caseinilytica]